MRIFATQKEESVVFKLPEGTEMEVVMLQAEGEECWAAPDVQDASDILYVLGHVDQPPKRQAVLKSSKATR